MGDSLKATFPKPIDKMKIPKVHIGQVVEQRIIELGMTKAEFGRRMDTSRQNVNTLLSKENWTVDMIASASRVLGQNFFLAFMSKGVGQEWGKARVRKGFKVWIEMDRRDDFEAFLKWWRENG